MNARWSVATIAVAAWLLGGCAALGIADSPEETESREATKRAYYKAQVDRKPLLILKCAQGCELTYHGPNGMKAAPQDKTGRDVAIQAVKGVTSILKTAIPVYGAVRITDKVLENVGERYETYNASGDNSSIQVDRGDSIGNSTSTVGDTVTSGDTVVSDSHNTNETVTNDTYNETNSETNNTTVNETNTENITITDSNDDNSIVNNNDSNDDNSVTNNDSNDDNSSNDNSNTDNSVNDSSTNDSFNDNSDNSTTN